MLPFIDLNYQYGLIKKNILAKIEKVLDSGHFILGNEVKEVEEKLAEYVGVKHAITCSSGTDALLMALMALGIKKGDAVFTTPFTFFATVETIALLGATPVFSDIDEKTFNIAPEKLELAIQKVEKEGKLVPKAIIPVDLFGLSADYASISEIAKKHHLRVIEDGCQGFGASDDTGKKVPSFGDISCTSFFPAKPLGCYGDGGAVFTDDDELFDLMDSILVHGRSNLDKYNNVRLGLNARFDTVQAAVILAKLEIFPHEVELRQTVAERYRENLSSILTLQHIPQGYTSVYAQFSVRSPKFDTIMQNLKKNDIPTARYYPIPMHLLKAMEYLNYKRGDMPNAESVATDIFALPMHPYLDSDTIDKICDVIAKSI